MIQRAIRAIGVVAVLWWVPLRSQPSPSQDAPGNTFGVYGRSAAGHDFIRITRKSDGKIGLALKLYYANGHTCELDKNGQWQGNRVVVRAEGLEESQPCKLEALFAGGRIVLKDDGGRCAQVYCGTRGTLDGVSLPKARTR